MLLRFLFPLWLVAACGHAEPVDHTEPVANDLTVHDISVRALKMSEDGWIVSRNPDGSPADRGDSLLFTGLAMGLMSCEDGALPEHALLNMLATNHGVPYRHPALQGEPYSLDGVLGLWWGISARVKACPESASAWIQLLADHDRVVSVPVGFDHVLHTVMAELGMRPGPTENERAALGSEVAAWATAVVIGKQPAFRLHLGYLVFTLVDAPKSRDFFCSVVPGAKMPLLEDMCGRDGLREWLAAFECNRFVYAHQRSPAWEPAPDANGKTTPAIDWLMAASRFGQ